MLFCTSLGYSHVSLSKAVLPPSRWRCCSPRRSGARKTCLAAWRRASASAAGSSSTTPPPAFPAVPCLLRSSPARPASTSSRCFAQELGSCAALKVSGSYDVSAHHHMSLLRAGVLLSYLASAQSVRSVRAEPSAWPAIKAAVLARVIAECAVAVHVVEAAGRTHSPGLHSVWLSVAAWACAGAGAGVRGAGDGLAAAHLRPPGHRCARSAAGARPALVGISSSRLRACDVWVMELLGFPSVLPCHVEEVAC